VKRAAVSLDVAGGADIVFDVCATDEVGGLRRRQSL
jgi:hypothetical protein